jgi:hypothetical protein
MRRGSGAFVGLPRLDLATITVTHEEVPPLIALAPSLA